MKDVLVLKKSNYVTKDNRAVYRIHLWIDDGAVEYCVCTVEEDIYKKITVGSKVRIKYDLNVFNSKIYGIKNIQLV